jgi:membrane protease subunit HflC
MSRFKVLILPLLALALLVVFATGYTVRQTESVLITRMGAPVRTITSPGLHFKLPLLESVLRFDKRLLDYDSAPREILARDKKNLLVDNYAKWRIVNPLKMYESVKSLRGAQARLDDIIYSELRQSLGNYTLEEIVKLKRRDIMKEVIVRANAQTTGQMGIEVVDVRIKGADLPPANEGAVYQRMQTERIRDAKLYRSEGEEAARKIRAEADKQKQIILAEAAREAEETRGRADAKAIRIFADAYGRDQDFFRFFRSLEAYRRSLTTGTTLVLTPEMEMLEYLQSSGARAQGAAGATQPMAPEAPASPAATTPTPPPPAEATDPEPPVGAGTSPPR